MLVQLLQHTREPERIIAQAAKLCYSDAGLETIAGKLSPEKTADFIRKLMEWGHLSALEHASFTFGIEGVSRALTHQLVRHRLASYSQQSQRYVSMRDFPYITPPVLSEKPELLKSFQTVISEIGRVYQELLESGIPAEDARYLLPNACETKIVVTMNARELLHFFRLRCCHRAQWEIHALADRMLNLAKGVGPNLFHQAGPGCINGPCPEGKLSCGKMSEVRQKYGGEGS
jgi:thymidylate synthase (FAD)